MGIFICKDCDDKQGGINKASHKKDHSLVSMKVAKDDEEDHESDEIEAIKNQLATQMGHIASLGKKVDRIEQLLESLLNK